uniref:Uncharacterized protein n=1 Tax=Triticum urartu TaxID=4572 RepID=A0A8R7UE77_TRIUA
RGLQTKRWISGGGGGGGGCGQVPCGAGALRPEVVVAEEEVAVAAGGADVTKEDLDDVGVGGGARPGADEVRRGHDVGDARGRDGVEARARGRRGAVDHGRVVDDHPWWVRGGGGGGEGAVEQVGDGGGEVQEAPERHDGRWMDGCVG